MPHGVKRSTVLLSLGIAVLLGFELAPVLQAQAEQGESPGFGFKEMLLYDLGRLEEKIVGLAEAMPAETYGWRPAEGVRSVSESFMHVCAGNQFFLGAIGVAIEGDPRELEKITDKGEVLAALRSSFSTVREAITAVSNEDLETEVEFFGQRRPKAAVLYILQSHMHEHLGQAIAYARSNGVVPPWSQPREDESG